MIYLAIIILGLTLGSTFAYVHYHRSPRILKPDNDNRPFTSEELRQIGIILPDPTRYDCETFVR
jgi:hypothetical protein